MCRLAEHLTGKPPTKDGGGRWPTVVDPNDKSGDDPPPLTPDEWAAEKRRQWDEQVARWEVSETRRVFKEGRHQGSTIEVSQARLDPRYNGCYHYDMASQSWQHGDDKELSITFGYMSGDKRGSNTLHPRWCIGATPPHSLLPYYVLSYSLERCKWSHGHSHYCGQDEVLVHYVPPTTSEARSD